MAKTRKTAGKGVRRAAAKPRRSVRRPAAGSVSPTQAIRRLDAEFMKAVAARDSSALVSAFYAHDAVLMPPGHPAVEGRDGIRAFLQGLIDAGASGIKLDTHTVVSAGNLAWGRGSYVLTVAPPAGVPGRDTGKYIVCYRRQPNGSWRAVADIFNSDGAAS